MDLDGAPDELKNFMVSIGFVNVTPTVAASFVIALCHATGDSKDEFNTYHLIMGTAEILRHEMISRCGCLLSYDLDDVIEAIASHITKNERYLSCSNVTATIEYKHTAGDYPDPVQLVAFEERSAMMFSDPLGFTSENSVRRSNDNSEVDLKSIGSCAADLKLQSNCVLCMSDFCESDRVVILDCKHQFHRGSEDCSGILEWLSESMTCPMCRLAVKLPLEMTPSETVAVDNGQVNTIDIAVSEVSNK